MNTDARQKERSRKTMPTDATWGGGRVSLSWFLWLNLSPFCNKILLGSLYGKIYTCRYFRPGDLWWCR